MARTATITRQTSESTIELSLDLDGTGKTDIQTSVPFYNHMMTALGKHSLIDLTIRATGDTDIDAHHTVEDTAIVFGEALKQALGDKRGIRRFADATVPLDEALAKAVVDVSGRPYCVSWSRSRSMLTSACICTSARAATRTISPKPSSRRSRARCGSRSSPTRASKAFRARRARCDGRRT